MRAPLDPRCWLPLALAVSAPQRAHDGGGNACTPDRLTQMETDLRKKALIILKDPPLTVCLSTLQADDLARKRKLSAERASREEDSKKARLQEDKKREQMQA